MSNLLLVMCFFATLLNTVLLIHISSELLDVQADLYYYMERKDED